MVSCTQSLMAHPTQAKAWRRRRTQQRSKLLLL